MGRLADIPDRSAVQEHETRAVWDRGDPRPSFHVVTDLYAVSLDKLKSITRDMDSFVQALKELVAWRGATALGHVSHIFYDDKESGAFTLLLLLQESHVSLHSWPEYAFVAVDAFTCGPSADPGLICKDIAELLGAQECDVTLLVRGPSDDTNMSVRTI